MDQSTLVSEYYRCLDDEYETLRSILHPEFVQQRPDRSFEGRAAFVEFMRTGRPQTDTTHRVDTLLESADGLAAYGRLFDAEGDELFEFIDVFRFDGGEIRAVDTFS
ncbi:nuclear transport factor 2 family protein [Halohasta salina]|uniref:nuclear transport factor 2 family protein n=1 Tax=Halohasta salina TaxID=2961621 RepID=UPI0020A44E51|nr:nuclear transport factor 2 family protein [Halohasta salina]